MGAEAAVAPDEMSFSWIKYQSKSGIVNFCVRNSGCTFLSPRLILSESKCWRITLEMGVSKSGLGTERGLGLQFPFL